MEIEIRRARAADVPAIVAMLADDALGRARETPGAPAYAAAFAAIEADANQLLAVLVADGAVAGTLQLSFIPGLSHGERGAARSRRSASRRRIAGPGRDAECCCGRWSSAGRGGARWCS